MLATAMEKETYRDCMRNHAATLGTYATDGCGEYTPDPVSPAGMQCAACGCHRNFHRKVLPLESSTDNTVGRLSPAAGEDRATSDAGKRRVRTKFSAEQKERMLRFSEKIGWRIPRRDGEVDEVGEFCREIGVSRQIFKVWMHNHKSHGGGSGGGGDGGGGGGSGVLAAASAGGGSSSSPSSSAAEAAAAAIVAAANANNNNTHQH